MSQDSPEMEEWKDEARRISVYEAFQKLKAPTVLKKTSEGFAGPCPKCGGNDRFSINTKDNLFNCRGCGAKGGDGLKLIMDIEDEPFMSAVEILAGRPRPDGGRTTASNVDEDALRERHEERRTAEALEAERERQAREKKQHDLQKFFDRCAPFKGSPAQTYLKNRKIVLDPEQYADLRFADDLDYYGYASKDAESLELLGQYPAMIAAIRDHKGNLIGIHYTYLDRDTLLKLKPPGDAGRNKAKKVKGEQQGGFIRLGPIRPVMAIGEGIETTAAWYLLGIGPDDIGILSGVNLGNIAGSAMDSIPHPVRKSQSIQNGKPVPREGHPSLLLPDGIKTVILLMDGDSDEYATTAKMLTAGRKFRDIDRKQVMICHPGGKMDFGDLLMKEGL